MGSTPATVLDVRRPDVLLVRTMSGEVESNIGRINLQKGEMVKDEEIIEIKGNLVTGLGD